MNSVFDVTHLLSAGLWSRPLLLVIVAALGYTAATVGMKMAAEGAGSVWMAFVAIGFLAATIAEIVLLRRAELGMIYLTIIGIETLLVLGYATYIGEGLDLRRILGASFVVSGIALVSH